MRAYRDFLPTAPEDLGIFVGLKTVPSMDPFPQEHWGKRACADHRRASTARRRTASKAHGAAARPAAGAALQLDGRRCRSRRCRALFDPFFPKGLQWYWKGDFVKTLSDEAIDTHIAAGRARRRASCA